MSDSISRQDAIDALKEAFNPSITNFVKAKMAIDNLPSAQPYTEEQIQKMQDMEQAQLEEAYRLGRESAQQWTPCSERLPKVDESVLATTAWNDVTIAWRIGVDEWFIHDVGTNATTEYLIAWMPLPEPYSEER